MKKRDTLYIVMPAYNEEANIRQVVEDWYPQLKQAGEASRLVIADSGSTDRTREILEELQTDHPQLEILPDTLKQHGPKLIALYRYAIDKGADFIFQTDTDGQTDPGEFLGFWKKRSRYAALLGNRKVRGDGKSRAFVEQVVCLLLYMIFGVRVPDANAPYRLMRAELVDEYLDLLPEDYHIPNIMLTTWFAYYREDIAFREITFKPRQGGKNSVDAVKIIKTGKQALGEFMAFRREMKKEPIAPMD